MKFLLFPTQIQAIQAEARVCENVRQAISLIDPARLAEDGTIYGVNAATWTIDFGAKRTERWAIPVPAAGGWVMPMPHPDEIAPIPLNVFLSGIDGQLIELDINQLGE